MKPSEVYNCMKSIFNVERNNCLEVFATIQKHPFLDVYGNNVQSFF